MSRRIKSVRAVAMAAAGLAGVGVLLAATSLYKVSSLENNKSPLFVAVDFEQGFYDIQKAGLRINPGEWMLNKAENICSENNCIIFNGGVVLGGDMIDLNAMLRSEFSIEDVAEKPMLNDKEIQDALKAFEASVLRASDD